MRKRMFRIVAVCILMAGIGLVSYPFLEEMESTRKQIKVIETFFDREKENKNKTENKVLYQDMKAYNEKLYQTGQPNMSDPFFYEKPAFDLTTYGRVDNVFGSIEIPKMNVKLPLYLGASKKNMRQGAVCLTSTSIPIGGENTNAVIAAHRGYGGMAMFREIQLLDKGDRIIIKNPFGTLHYQVEETKVILPDATENIKIIKGEDRITLITCHPYTKNYRRYVVYCKRIGEKISEKRNSYWRTEFRQLTHFTTLSNSEQRILIEKYLPLIIVFLVLVVSLSLLLQNRKKKAI